MLLLLIVTSLTLEKSTAISIEENCKVITLPTLPLSVDGKRLETFTYSNESTIDKISCLKRCLRQRKCKSINYNTDIYSCQLNAESHVTQPSSLKLTNDATQYYPLDDLNEEMLGRCNGHGCSDELICQELPYGSSDPYQCITEAELPTSVIITTTPSSTTCNHDDGCANCLPQQYSMITFNFRPIGCFHAKGSPNILPTLVQNFRSNIDWSNLYLIVSSCATLASSSGYKYFGIEYWGECWVASSFDPASHSLVSSSICQSKCYQGVADAHKMFIYEIF